MAKPRPSKDVLEDAARVAKHNVRLLEFLRDWEQRELAELPMRTDNVAVGQGRCQVLQELVKFLEDAPSNVAKS
jgi:hypothetical protein